MANAQKFRLGMKGKLFFGAGGTTGVPTTELDNVSDVTITLDALCPMPFIFQLLQKEQPCAFLRTTQAAIGRFR